MLEHDPVIKALRERIASTESRIEDVYEAIMGNPKWQTVGIRQELNNLRQDRENDKRLLEGLIAEKEREAHQREGQRKLLRVIGISSVASAVTLLVAIAGVVVALFQAGVSGGV